MDKRQLDCLRVSASVAAFLFFEETASISVEPEVGGWGGGVVVAEARLFVAAWLFTQQLHV